MQTYNQVVFDNYVSSSASSVTLYSDSAHDETIGLPDQVSIAGYTAQVTGAAPTLTLQLEHSFDQVRWQNRNASTEVAAVPLSTSGEALFQGMDGDRLARPALPYARVRITLAGAGGTAASGQVRIWITGRDALG